MLDFNLLKEICLKILWIMEIKFEHLCTHLMPRISKNAVWELSSYTCISKNIGLWKLYKMSKKEFFLHFFDGCMIFVFYYTIIKHCILFLVFFITDGTYDTSPDFCMLMSRSHLFMVDFYIYLSFDERVHIYCVFVVPFVDCRH